MAITETRIKHGNVSKAIKDIVKNSNLELGVQIASQAKALSPVDLGQLRNSISASNLEQTVLLNNKQGDEAKELNTSGLKDDEVYVGSNSDHALYQEYGTIRQPAQPFLRPSAELKAKGSNVADIVSKYNAKAMKEELKERQKTVKKYGN